MKSWPSASRNGHDRSRPYSARSTDSFTYPSRGVTATMRWSSARTRRGTLLARHPRDRLRALRGDATAGGLVSRARLHRGAGYALLAPRAM